MSVTNDLIGLMSSAEQQGFIAYLKGRNKRHDSKNVDLFRKLVAKKEQGLKSSLSANAYAALKKRLTDNLLDFLSITTVEQEATEEIGIIRLLLVARKLFAHQKYKSAFAIIKKAELRAEAINHYSLLNEIYQTAIENAHFLSDEEQDLVISKFEDNQNELIEQGKLNLVYSVVRKAYQKVEKQGEQIDLQSLLAENYNRFNISKERGYNFKSLFQIAQLADFAGAASKDYYSVDTFFESKIEEIAGTELDAEKHLVYHIDLLYLLANIYFRKQLFEKSLNFLEKMKVQMLRSNSRFYAEKEAAFETLRALNLNYLGDYQAALGLLDNVLKPDHEVEQLLNPLMCKMMIHFQQGELPEAKAILAQFSRTDQWYEKQMGQEWLLYKNFADILLNLELNHIDYADARMTSLKRKLSSTKVLHQYPRIRIYLKWIDQYMRDSTIVHTKKFKQEVEHSIEWKPREEEDIFLMTFYAWLKAKMEGRGVYEVTLGLLGR